MTSNTNPYVITYWFRDPRYGREHEGIQIEYSLTEVYAFCEMVTRYGGRATCNISSDR